MTFSVVLYYGLENPKWYGGMWLDDADIDAVLASIRGLRAIHYYGRWK